MTSPECWHSEERVTLDQMFTAVSHPARRRVLLAVKEKNPRTAAAFETGEATPRSKEGPHSRVALHHVHLPHLADAGFIDWDRSTDTITKGPHFEEIRPLLEWITEQADDAPDTVA